MFKQILIAIIKVIGTLIETIIINYKCQVSSRLVWRNTGFHVTSTTIIILLLTGCGSGNNQTIPQVQVVKSDAPPEKRVVSKESLPQQNCGGSSMVTNEIERTRTIQFTLDVKGSITVDGGGEAEIPGVGKFNVGVAVAHEYGVGYGESTSMSRKIAVSARDGTSVVHNIQQVEYWQTGTIIVLLNGKTITSYPYQFRTDFNIELINTQPLSCPTVVIPSNTAVIPSNTAVVPYGPYSGQLIHEDNNFIQAGCLQVELQNFIAEITFHNPYSKELHLWSYGLLFRTTGANYGYRMSINSNGRVGFGLNQGSATGKILWEVDFLNYIDTSESGKNKILLNVHGGDAELYINNHFVSTLDVSDKQVAGYICAATGILKNDKIPGKSTFYDGLTVTER